LHKLLPAREKALAFQNPDANQQQTVYGPPKSPKYWPKTNLPSKTERLLISLLFRFCLHRQCLSPIFIYIWEAV